MPYGYLGQNTPNQTVANSGVFSITDLAELQSQGKLGGSLELIEEQTITSSTATMDFTSIQENVYDVHYLTFENFTGVNDSNLVFRLSNDGGSSFISSGYQFAQQYGGSNGSFAETKSTSYAQQGFLSTNANAGGNGNGYVYLYNLGNSSKYSFDSYQSTNLQSSSTFYTQFGGAVLPTAETHNAIRLFVISGNINTLTAKLYGVKQI